MLLPFITIYYSKEFGIGIAGLLVAITSIIQILCIIFGGHITENVGRLPLMKIGEILKFIAFTFLLLFPNPYMIFICVTIVSGAQGFINPSIDAMLIDECESELSSKILSLNNWIYNISYLAGAMIGGWLFEKYLFIIIIILMSTTIFIIFQLFRNVKETYKIIDKQAKSNGRIFGLINSYRTALTNIPFLIYLIGILFYLLLQRMLTNYIAVNFPEKTIEPLF